LEDSSHIYNVEKLQWDRLEQWFSF